MIYAGEIQYPFYSPRGEFRLSGLDGYGVTLSHVGE
jgi:hypothetical protein